MQIEFLGAAHEVTGSCHYVTFGDKHVLVDCGMEQGPDLYVNQEIPVNAAAVEVTPGTTGYDVMRQIKTLLAERPAYQYFRICLQGYKDPDVIFDLDKLSHLERIVDVTEQLRPDYDYEKLLAEHENSLLGAYIADMQKKRQDPVAAKALEYGVSALLGHEICR